VLLFHMRRDDPVFGQMQSLWLSRSLSVPPFWCCRTLRALHLAAATWQLHPTTDELQPQAPQH
jgi:hypothetical protein